MIAETLILHGSDLIKWCDSSGFIGKPPQRIQPATLHIEIMQAPKAVRFTNKSNGTLLWRKLSADNAYQKIFTAMATQMDLLPPVAANQFVSGRVSDPSGKFLPRLFTPTLGVEHEVALYQSPLERLWQGLGASLTDPTPGVRVLFAGESGAGKTLAASRFATVLGAPLFRVDLAAVMNKYIGESEKNLGRVLDEAAALDAILLMDEADTLFGRRNEGKETGERYANMLTNFLLTCIENHSGIVVLTSNSRNRIDTAFSRRFDSIIEFPLPGVEERFRLWRSHRGMRAPEEKICRLLASYCDLAGGHIRNCVLNAAALSDQPADTPLSMIELMNALRTEYRKLGRTLPPQLEQLSA